MRNPVPVRHLVSVAVLACVLCSGGFASCEETAEKLFQEGAYAAAAAIIAKTPPPDPWQGRSAWKDLFRQQGQLRVLLETLIEADPEDGFSRLELLDLEQEPLDVTDVAALEELLQPDSRVPFRGYKGGPTNRTRFSSYFDLAYRLMRLYEKQGDVDRLCALGLRIARGDEPFRNWWFSHRGLSYSHGQNGEREYLSACLALTVQHAGDEALAELDQCLPDERWLSARAQLNRRTGKDKAPEILPPVGWANLPPGVSAWVCNDAVLAVAYDDKYIYAGMPWGVMVYGRSGAPVTRVALAAAAEHLAVQGSYVWAGGFEGLFRIKRDTWDVGSLPLDRHVPQNQRDGDGRYNRLMPTALMALDSIMWIGTPGTVQRFDTTANELKAYEGIGSRRFVHDGSRLWCTGKSGSARYDREKDSWETLDVLGLRIINGVLWGESKVNEKIGYRPCKVDANTLEVTPILIDESEPYAQTHNMGGTHGWNYRGLWEGKPAFDSYYYDEASGVLRALPGDAQVDAVQRRIRSLYEVGVYLSFRTEPVELPDGSHLCGLCPEYVSGYEYPQHEKPTEHELSSYNGGLYLIPPEGTVTKLSAFLAADSLPSDIVTGLAFGPGRNWVCTNRGLAAFDMEKGVSAFFRREDGLCGNRVTGGAVLEDKDYFSVGYGDNGGGLCIYDPRSRVFTALMKPDGLALNKLAGIEPQGDSLRLTYGMEYVRSGDAKYLMHPPGIFDPRGGTITPGGPAREVPRDEAEAARWKEQDLPSAPFLAGKVLFEQKNGEQTYLCGTRGLIIVSDGAARLELSVNVIEPRIALNPEEALRAAASEMPVSVKSPADLARYLADPNPFVKIKALNAVPRLASPASTDEFGKRHSPQWIAEPYVPVIAGVLSDPDDAVREKAVTSLLQGPATPESTDALKTRLADSHTEVRALAAMELLRRGEKIDAGIVRWLLESKRTVHSIFEHELYKYLAPLADAEIFELLLEFPPGAHRDNPTEVYPALGASLRRHPEAADILLHVEPAGTYHEAARELAVQSLGFACPAILPVLNEAIVGNDPPARANAALACGYVDDPAAIGCLEQCLNIKDGQTQRAAVRALAESKRPESPPLLVRFFVQSSVESEPFRKKLDQIFAQMEINDPTNASRREEIVQIREEHLFPDYVRETVNRHPEKAQEFYRLLASEDDFLCRVVAAEQLGMAKNGDLAKNMPVLRRLLNDSEPEVRVKSLASLVLLGDEPGQEAFAKVLRECDEEALIYLLRAIQYARSIPDLSFVRPHIEAIIQNPELKNSTRTLALEVMNKL